MSDFTLSDLEKIVAERANASPEESYTAKLISRGMDVAAKKLGEEAVEAVIAANHALGEAMRITGTPTFVVGRQMLRGYLPREAMEQVVAAERG